jgi:putative toxin-antitoxin system antitoxin component (TIGR02293 family)
VIHDPQDSATTGVSEKPPENPKEALAFRERIELMARVLRELPVRDREVLTRIYLYEQSPDQVCSEMSLTETQFRLLISRVKARFGRLARARLIKESDIELGTNRNATPELSRIVPVIAHAVAVFGDEHKASHWLVTRLPLLGDRSPSQVLEEPEGIKLVEQILTRIEHNIPS